MALDSQKLSKDDAAKLEKIKQMEYQYKAQEEKIVELLENNPQLKGRINRKLK
jgi:hypothetical protein